MKPRAATTDLSATSATHDLYAEPAQNSNPATHRRVIGYRAGSPKCGLVRWLSQYTVRRQAEQEFPFRREQLCSTALLLLSVHQL